ncbi:hypothetical protein RJ639_011399 [Escallonia herrerae]|uniref:CCHC-type domain-containing protein n=1 Tax=Escallonia herrerae TaxID=1293975 RepID=A0AA88VS14_9ASTE|nr:hypothetical protein RJ639_011399 [Escallonia herrerae]
MAQGRSTDHAGSKNKGRLRSQSKAKKLKCYYCHKGGHYKKDCPERKGKKKDNYKTANAGVVEDNSDGADVLSITISSSNGGWILDTGCSYHMCPNRDWFATYRSFNGGKVLMGNDVACKVVGIGSIQIKMHDGIDSTVRGAATTASSSDIDSNTTKLWHMRLGHMSERDMDVLSKQEVWSGKHANYENLRIFGCLAYAHVNDCKLEPRAKKCIFLGYANGVKGYRLWCPNSESSKFLIRRDVTFDESLMLSKKELIDAGKHQGIREKVELEVRAPDSLPIIPTGKEDGSHSTEENEEPREQQYNIARNRPRRKIQPPQKYGYADMVAYAHCGKEY